MSESDEANNAMTAAAPIKIVPAVSSGAVTVKGGQKINVSFGVKNQGMAVAKDEFTVAVFLSKNAIIDPARDIAIGENGLQALKVEQTVQRQTGVAIGSEE